MDLIDKNAHIYTPYDPKEELIEILQERDNKNNLLNNNHPGSVVTSENQLDNSTNPTSDIKIHKKGELCFLPNQTAKIWLYGVPIFTLGLFNLGILAITLYRLHKSSQNPKTVTLRKHVITKSISKPGKKIIKSTFAGVLGTKWQRTMVYVKLMTITGLTWSIGLLASITGQEIITRIFCILKKNDSSRPTWYLLDFMCFDSFCVFSSSCAY